MKKKNKSRNYSSKTGKIKFDINRNKSNNVKTVQMKNYNKNKIKLIPPLKPGIFSYNKSIQEIPQKKIDKEKNSRNIKKNNNFFSSNAYSMNPNYIQSSSNENNNNYANNMFFSTVNKKGSTKNSLLSHSSINLNKYKINSNEINNNIIKSFENSEKQNINKFVNKSINLKINVNYENKKTNNEQNNIKRISHYKNYFISEPKYKIESRRMILEYIKILNKKEKNIKNVLNKNNFSERVLNQKYTYKKNDNLNNKINNSIKNNNDDNNNNEIILGEGKKELFLKNLNNSFSRTSEGDSNKEDYYEKNSNNKGENKTFTLYKRNNFSFINSLGDQRNKKISIINFLCVPKVLNIIESNKKSEKYIFILSPDESTYIKGIESYKLVLRNLINNEIENEFNIKDIKQCYINERSPNRFFITVQSADFNELNFEIETPNSDICEYFTFGIKYLKKNFNK